MSKFELNIPQIEQEEALLNNTIVGLGVSMMQLWLPILNLRLYCFLKRSNLEDKLSSNYQYLKVLRNNTLQLKRTLNEIKEVVIQDEANASKIMSTENAAKDSPFDETGDYGGKQASPREHWEELAGIVRKYYPEKSDDEVRNYLDKLNTEGCGYVACINTVFLHYMNRESEFLKTFGFPMYKSDGTLNYDALITDFYSATDNHNKRNGIDSIDENEDPSATKGYGTTPESREYRFEKYMSDHGIAANIENDVPITPKNYSDYAQNHNIIIRIRPVRLTDQNGMPYVDNGGHAMTVTGVTDDGKYIVSSWGKEFYVDSSDQFDYIEFQTVRYR